MFRLLRVLTAFFLSQLIGSTALHAQPMTTKQLPSITIVGISVRTNNAAEMSGKGAIGEVWTRFFQEGILENIPNRADSNIIALYTDYESDHTGDYTFVLGARVTTTVNLPKGMIVKEIPAGKYATFESEKGSIPGIVMNAWKRIWSASKENWEEFEALSRTTNYTIKDLKIRTMLKSNW
jgi:predicted transcriptional regulator YdeE